MLCGSCVHAASPELMVLQARWHPGAIDCWLLGVTFSNYGHSALVQNQVPLVIKFLFCNEQNVSRSSELYGSIFFELEPHGVPYKAEMQKRVPKSSHCSSKGNKNVPHALELLHFMGLLQCHLIRETFRQKPPFLAAPVTLHLVPPHSSYLRAVFPRQNVSPTGPERVLVSSTAQSAAPRTRPNVQQVLRAYFFHQGINVHGQKE